MSSVKNQSAVVSSFNKLSIFMLLCIVVAFVASSYSNMMTQRALDEKRELQFNAMRFIGGSGTLTNEVRAYSATGKEVHYKNYWREINDDKNRDIGLANMRAIGITDAEEQLISEMSSISNNLVPLEEEAMQSVKAGDLASAINYVYGDSYSTAIAKIRSIAAEFTKSLEQRSDRRIAAYEMVDLATTIVMGVLIAIIIVIQVLNMRFVRHAIIMPILRIRDELQLVSRGSLATRLDMPVDESEIGQLVESVKMTKRELKNYIGNISTNLHEMANGNLDLSIDIDYLGDFAPIKQSLAAILDSLNNMISKMSTNVISAANDITDRAQKVSNGADELAHGATEQANVIEGLSTTVKDLSDEMNDIAESAARSHKNTEDAATDLERSSGQMADILAAMEEISGASEGIKKITDTIANIGSRTNIVAINAAIEAAKAGDVGRGFAVVADEVRNLAIMCSDASRETDKLLESTLRSVERGMELTQHMTDAMQKLIDVARDSATSVAHISEQSSQQASSLRSVSNGFQQITGVVEENAATAEVSAAAATELNELADGLQRLRDLFSSFKLRS